MRIPLTCLMFLASAGLCLGDEPKPAAEKPEPKEELSGAEQLQALKKEKPATYNELLSKFRLTKDAKEQKAIRDQLTESIKSATKALDIAEKNTKDDLGLEAALKAIEWGGPGVAPRASKILVENYVDSPKLLPLVPMLAEARTGGQEALAKLAKKGGTEQIRAIASFTLFSKEVEEADYGAEARKRDPEESKKVFAALRERLDEMVAEYGDVKTGTAATSPTVKVASEKVKFFLDNLVVGTTAPEVAAELLDGKEAKLSNFKGKVVVLDVWATWCGPCRAMIPHEREMVKKLEGRPFELISVSCDEKKKTLEEFLEKEEMPWTHFWAGRGKFTSTYQIRFYPTVYVLDGKGVIRYKHLRGEALEEAVQKLIEENEKEAAGG